MEPQVTTNILLLCTGSIAVKKVAQIVEMLKEKNDGVVIRLIASPMAKQLAVQYAESPAESSFAETWQTEEDITVAACEHIQAMKWADIGVLLPMSANTLAKITAGICDNYILSIIRAWPFTEQRNIAKPFLVSETP
eukprot:Protomagalhaensia_wolfi_Nauph_80__1212@NODE_1714_length_1384_cov_199_748699_g1330_i0_p2_GENE_NODE_1714_length_1384_cov_199_748699_g1330_i0NODE_1714_length_1384_cov_199_748699_g1330_i0_p2_ORF_typecomplete_len137_score22_31Flavoprotein/PF02441_19/1_2e24_NODE_1714_length_1384_cov_199_748699_g1330_i0118528